jgi:hypothetical protein
VNRKDRKRPWIISLVARTGLLAGVVYLTGCSEPGEGSAQVGSEARQRLAPQAGPKATAGKPEGTGGKTFSIKDRAPSAPKK